MLRERALRVYEILNQVQDDMAGMLRKTLLRFAQHDRRKNIDSMRLRIKSAMTGWVVMTGWVAMTLTRHCGLDPQSQIGKALSRVILGLTY